ncbi:hypothetical protein [Lysobacter enzymogenes]|uniref:hypothetical protein n=1 Tax=Lysobacter enzymogenes TaxID=69 RepID=UPI002265085F|nr:hypothetical protein [Lysobacter enzymogenes]UZW62738.1 hypothetical protein BV903_010785 [Lysobacter enzymogenes]
MGIGDKTLGFIRAGTGNPTLESISSVADYLRVKTWQLLAPNAEIVTATELDPAEAELLELFRLTSPEMRAALLTSARASLAASSDDSSAALIRRVNPKHREKLKELGLISDSGNERQD